MNDEQFNLLLNELKAIKVELKKPKTKKICPECKQHTLYIVGPKGYTQTGELGTKAQCFNEQCGHVEIITFNNQYE